MNKPVRTFLGKPLRDISIEYNRDPITLDEFIDGVKGGLDGFKGNMLHLGENNKEYFANHPHYMEEWVESFLAWFEVEQDPDV